MKLQLSLINNWLNTQKRFQLIEIYILLCILFLSPIYFLEEHSKSIVTPNTTPKETFSPIKYLSKFEKIAKEDGVNIVKSTVDRNSFELYTLSTMDSLKNFIAKVENYNQQLLLKDIEIKKDSEKFKAYLHFEYQNNRFRIIGNLREHIQKKELASEQYLKLNAIIGEYIKIGEEWYKIGDRVGKYKFVKVLNNKVLLSNDKEELILEVFKNVEY